MGLCCRASASNIHHVGIYFIFFGNGAKDNLEMIPLIERQRSYTPGLAIVTDFTLTHEPLKKSNKLTPKTICFGIVSPVRMLKLELINLMKQAL